MANRARMSPCPATGNSPEVGTRVSGVVAMSDEPFFTPNLKVSKGRQARPGELLFELFRERDHTRWRCELREHEYGCDVQFFRNEEFIESRNFTRPAGDPRTLAIAWAEEERKVLERGSRE